MSPLVLPGLAFGLAALMYFTLLGFRPSLELIIAGHLVVVTPFVLRTVGASLSQLDPALLDASASLGAGPLRTFGRITLPLIAPGIAAGAFLAFMASVDNVPVSLFLSSARTDMLPIRMWGMMESTLDVRVAAVSGTLILRGLPAHAGDGTAHRPHAPHAGLTMYLKAEPLTSAAFLPYGEVIECPAMPGRTYFEDAMANLRPKARPSISLIVAEPPLTALPLRSTTMERHEFSSQSFIPQESGRWLAIVAPHAAGGRAGHGARPGLPLPARPGRHLWRQCLAPPLHRAGPAGPLRHLHVARRHPDG